MEFVLGVSGRGDCGLEPSVTTVAVPQAVPEAGWFGAATCDVLQRVDESGAGLGMRQVDRMSADKRPGFEIEKTAHRWRDLGERSIGLVQTHRVGRVFGDRLKDALCGGQALGGLGEYGVGFVPITEAIEFG